MREQTPEFIGSLLLLRDMEPNSTDFGRSSSGSVIVNKGKSASKLGMNNSESASCLGRRTVTTKWPISEPEGIFCLGACLVV